MKKKRRELWETVSYNPRLLRAFWQDLPHRFRRWDQKNLWRAILKSIFPFLQWPMKAEEALFLSHSIPVEILRWINEGPPSCFHPGHSPEDRPRDYYSSLSVNKPLKMGYATASLGSKPGKIHPTSLACHAGKVDPIVIITDEINQHCPIFFYPLL